jgi:hypothetical protein
VLERDEAGARSWFDDEEEDNERLTNARGEAMVTGKPTGSEQFYVPPAPTAHEPAPIRRGLLYEPIPPEELIVHVRSLLAREQRPMILLISGAIVAVWAGMVMWLYPYFLPH